MSSDSEVKITDVEQARRFEAHLGGELVGFLTYVRDEKQVDYQHTVVGLAYEGLGIGSALARVALDDGRERGIHVKLTCPFLKEWVTHHPEYQPAP